MMMQVLMLVATVAVSPVLGELFSSMAHLQSALYAERDIAQAIRQYIENEQGRLKNLAAIADEFESHSKMALQNPDIHLGNPVNAYLFVKHFTLDWDRDIEITLKNNSREELTNRVEELRQNLPTYEDLTGSVNALLRLQDTYKLDTTEIAQGNVGGQQSTQLSAWDCFELGRLAYNEEDYYHTVSWMEEALTKNTKREDGDDDMTADIIDYLAFSVYKVGRQAYIKLDYYHTIMWMQEAYERASFEKNSTVTKIKILDYLTYSMYKQGNLRRALALTTDLLSIDPTHSRARSNKAYYEKMIEMEDKNTDKRGDDGEITNTRHLDEYRNGPEFKAYEALCRGEDLRDYKLAHTLICRYHTNNNPMLLLMPVKEEVLYWRPFITKFHDTISDKDIAMIKSLATPKLGRATVHNPKTGKLETAQYRVSKSCWLNRDDSPDIERINQRIQAVTGLNMATAEELQIANYGIGGQYEPHYDFARKREPTAFEARVGNRIATFMFYISDVQAGGATVFPQLGLKVFPQKATALFWYNLNKNGDGIYETRHAACPVLVGSKWVSNKWIHERGQEFFRPCGLREEE